MGLALQQHTAGLGEVADALFGLLAQVQIRGVGTALPQEQLTEDRPLDRRTRRIRRQAQRLEVVHGGCLFLRPATLSVGRRAAAGGSPERGLRCTRRGTDPLTQG